MGGGVKKNSTERRNIYGGGGKEKLKLIERRTIYMGEEAKSIEREQVIP